MTNGLVLPTRVRGDIMNQREWLIANGFNPGKRGRFSKEMLDALAGSGIAFDKPVHVPKKREVKESVNHLAPNPFTKSIPVRESKTLYGLSVEGYKIGFSLCFECSQHMSFCTCKGGPLAPSSVIKALDKDMRVRA